MAITLGQTQGTLKAFRRTAEQFQFQATFQTPLKNLRPFVRAIMLSPQPIQQGRVTIDQIVFEPKTVNALLAKCGIVPPEPRKLQDRSRSASGKEEVEELLVAMLSDWIDFAFIPSPKRFLMYANHDEYATFFASRKSTLNQITAPLSAPGTKEKNYRRNF
jgi:hypothetical protein